MPDSEVYLQSITLKFITDTKSLQLAQNWLNVFLFVPEELVKFKSLPNFIYGEN